MKLDPEIVLDSHPEVYEPAEDSYLLLDCVRVKGDEKVLEIGTGCGLVALHCAKIADVMATDINPHAVELTKRNAKLNNLQLKVLESDLFKSIDSKFDVIIFNPPYLCGEKDKREDWLNGSWSGGSDGDEVVLEFLAKAKEYLKPHGRIYLLVSSNNKRTLDEISKTSKAKKLNEKRLFYELLIVFELTL